MENSTQPAKANPEPASDSTSLLSDEPKRPISDNTWSGLLFFLLISAIVLTLVFWPWIFGSKSAMQAPPITEYGGVVQKTSFIGGFRTDTQVDTDMRTLLARGIANVKRGTPLETRIDYFHRQVCEVGTHVCYELGGH